MPPDVEKQPAIVASPRLELVQALCRVRLCDAGIQTHEEALPKTSIDQEHVSVVKSSESCENIGILSKEKQTTLSDDMKDFNAA